MSSELENAKVMPFTADQKIYENIKAVLTESRSKMLTAINSVMVQVYWEIGHEINNAIGKRAEYGKELLQFLAKRLTADFGKGFKVSNLRNMRQFHQTFPIRYAVRSELSWTHYRMLMRVSEPNRREFYLNESIESGWTARQLERQINSLFYERLLATQKSGKGNVAKEIFELEPRTDADSILKDPYVLEFLDLKENKDYRESELEQALIDNLQDFLLELGKGFSFVARQKRITTDYGKHYYIDLVFYNYILKCFVIIDLKTSDLSFQDVGQIDFYTRLFDDKIKQDNDAPTIGIVLCAGKDETIAKYSVLADKANLYAANYLSYLPTEDELKTEIKYQRETIERRLLLEKEGDAE
ncbi:MAG: PDDEXK nuclease domain-containing protein [Defluviitaleaceae bacterium]|nr:PDDEXK nuclease domain-containing protein [Defluviitaleaceae bacterium]